ncbi:AraC family transcriptional regulator [Pseudorhodoferax sp.]|uniref:AraC family transcriptional regulator n=1 Tax=Pseudorhodoferax sp. TaxID=1993553 RepID=UPI002DD689CF|nr:helix-turn-helix domain-containing protein [Pseudorhodoferax sp.]
MTITVHLSPKLALTVHHGFALHHSGQPHYTRDWHAHDCAMLLWPLAGGLQARWHAGDGADGGDAAPAAARLARSTALLLPTATAHHTQASTARLHHGELYLAPELLGRQARFGALRIDGALQALLDALVAPALDARSAEPLVDAIVRQIRFGPSRALAQAPAPAGLAERMVQRFAQALEHEQALPQIDAVAQALGVSVRQLQRACDQAFGASPVDVRRRLLAAHARALMAQGCSLAQASQALGFASSGHLGRLLRAIPA